MNNNIPPIMQVGNILISSDLITECFCCDLDACKGACCIEGDAGAPVTLDEIAAMEDHLDIVWNDLSAQAQAVIDKQGVACTDREGDLVTSIVNRKDCVFTCYDKDLCLCTFDRAHRAGRCSFRKPISCALSLLGRSVNRAVWTRMVRRTMRGGREFEGRRRRR